VILEFAIAHTHWNPQSECQSRLVCWITKIIWSASCVLVSLFSQRSHVLNHQDVNSIDRSENWGNRRSVNIFTFRLNGVVRCKIIISFKLIVFILIQVFSCQLPFILLGYSRSWFCQHRGDIEFRKRHFEFKMRQNRQIRNRINFSMRQSKGPGWSV
jgi:hypothetical protein